MVDDLDGRDVRVFPADYVRCNVTLGVVEEWLLR